MTIPGLQNPHCVPLNPASADWMGWSEVDCDPRPSTVAIFHPSHRYTGVMHWRHRMF